MSTVNQTAPFVAVFMVTYNHEKYIAQAIESVLIQRTNFLYKIYLGEDCSTDNTRSIVEEYRKRFADKIEIFLTDKNDIKKNSRNIYDACFNSGAKYIAMLEGDDYWTDPDKLQKQVDFLEAHPQYSYVCSRFSILNDVTGSISSFGDEYFSDEKNKIITIDNFFSPYISKTLTVVFRKEYLKVYFLSSRYLLDMTIFFHLLQSGNAYCFNEDMGVYRMHSGGMGSSLNKWKNNKWLYDISSYYVISYGNKYESVKRFHKQQHNRHLNDIINNKKILPFFSLCLKELKCAFLGYNNYFLSSFKKGPLLLKRYLVG